MAQASSKLSFLDRYLSIWIFAAMVIGISLSYLISDISQLLALVSFKQVNIPLALGLIIMMYPPLAKIDFRKLTIVFANKKQLWLSIIQNWIFGPVLMYLLAIALLPDHPPYITGMILIGIARCIAMVLVWNDLAKGDAQYAAGLVAINSLFQLLFYPLYAWAFSSLIPRWLGLSQDLIEVSYQDVAISVGLYLGIPFGLAVVTRMVLLPSRGDTWYHQTFLKKVSPLTLIALLLTITLMFALQGRQIVQQPLEVLRIALPLTGYFVIMFFLAFFTAKGIGTSKPQAVSMAFTAAGNNFELAIAVAIATFGIASPEALATTVGPLIEVPVLLLLVNWVNRFNAKKGSIVATL